MQMVFLSKENEVLLKECIENDSDFPRILRQKFEGLSPMEDNSLRRQINVLIDNDYISKLQWGDNRPLWGRIEQKGYEYFKRREVYIRAKLRQDPYFDLLDDESEKVLSGLLEHQDAQIFISGDINLGRIYENLGRRGFIKLPYNGLSYDFNREFTGFVTVTQEGKNYFIDKENRIEEILILGDEAAIMTKVDKQYNINGSFSGSQFQLGDHNSQYVNTTEYSELLSELKQQVESIKMSANQTEELNSLIEKAQELSKGNDIGGVRKVLSEIWDVVKQIGIPILTTYVSMKFGLR